MEMMKKDEKIGKCMGSGDEKMKINGKDENK